MKFSEPLGIEVNVYKLLKNYFPYIEQQCRRNPDNNLCIEFRLNGGLGGEAIERLYQFVSEVGNRLVLYAEKDYMIVSFRLKRERLI